jgi:hypothetical protein
MRDYSQPNDREPKNIAKTSVMISETSGPDVRRMVLGYEIDFKGHEIEFEGREIEFEGREIEFDGREIEFEGREIEFGGRYFCI